ncbi:unnamed protein product [Triticum turgidum subsp. durum]|uniref:HVA22-like protein n=2 Tax=Triticinae TaxID=1648030 RepID=A0A9R0X0L0_TRITD|nr:unnamed protein product [Triticum turgidum subsp. durum]
MSKLWTILTHLHTLAGPGVMLLYPLYASVQAMESPSKLDDEQWLAYWILYSFVTLVEMVLESLIYWDTDLVRAEAAVPGVAGAAQLQGSGLHLRQVRQGAAQEARPHQPPRQRHRQQEGERLQGRQVVLAVDVSQGEGERQEQVPLLRHSQERPLSEIGAATRDPSS